MTLSLSTGSNDFFNSDEESFTPNYVISKYSEFRNVFSMIVDECHFTFAKHVEDSIITSTLAQIAWWHLHTNINMIEIDHIDILTIHHDNRSNVSFEQILHEFAPLHMHITLRIVFTNGNYIIENIAATCDGMEDDIYKPPLKIYKKDEDDIPIVSALIDKIENISTNHPMLIYNSKTKNDVFKIDKYRIIGYDYTYLADIVNQP